MLPELRNIALRVSEYLGTSVQISENLLQTLFVILALLLIRYLCLALVYWRSQSPTVYYNFKRYSAQAFFVIGLFLIGFIWFEGFQSLATFLGLLSVGLALALRDLLTDLAGWIYIVGRKPFEMGDRIEVAGVKGDVIDKRLLTFSVNEVGNRVDAEQSSGRIIHIPNHKVFSGPLANYTSGFPYIWHEIPVTITYGSDHQKAREILSEIALNHASEYIEEAQKAYLRAQESFMLKVSVFTPAVFVAVREQGICLTIRYLCPVRSIRGIEQAISLEIIERFRKEPDIQYAYRSFRLHDGRSESV